MLTSLLALKSNFRGKRSEHMIKRFLTFLCILARWSVVLILTVILLEVNDCLMSMHASGTHRHLGLVYDAVPFNDPPPPISPPVSSSRALEEHLEAWPLSCYYTIWCLLQLTLVKPGEACQPCRHCPFYVSQHSPRTPALADTPQMTYCHCVKREWGVTDELEHPSSRWKWGEKRSSFTVNLFFPVNLHHSTNPSTNLWYYWEVKWRSDGAFFCANRKLKVTAPKITSGILWQVSDPEFQPHLGNPSKISCVITFTSRQCSSAAFIISLEAAPASAFIWSSGI